MWGLSHRTGLRPVLTDCAPLGLLCCFFIYKFLPTMPAKSTQSKKSTVKKSEQSTPIIKINGLSLPHVQPNL